jgi:hypothetical protein
MHRILLVLTLVFVVMLVPNMQHVAAGEGDCVDSFPTAFASATAGTPMQGEIAQVFSTFRNLAAGPDVVRVLSPATFTVTDQRCVNGLSWLQVTYSSGTTVNGTAASSLGTGWALESQRYFDGLFGPGTWLVPAGGEPPVGGTCEYSYASQFVGASGENPIRGQIAEYFSTLRTAPGAFGGTRVLAPAEFTATEQRCVGGFSWVYITYASGIDEFGNPVQGMSGWALESQTYFDGTYGPGTWLEPLAVVAE